MPERISGWRLNIGVISPAPVLSRFFREFHAVVPEGIDCTAVTLSVRRVTDEELAEAIKGVERAAEQLAQFDVDLIYVIGVPAIVMQGPGSDHLMIDRIKQVSGLPAIVDITGVMRALRAMQLKKVALATPFEDVVNERMVRFLAAEGFDIVHHRGLGIRRNVEIRNLPLSAEYDQARRTFLESPVKPDGLYIPCGAWGTIDNVPRLERELETTVVTWFNALIWSSMKLHGVGGPITGYGKLLGTL